MVDVRAAVLGLAVLGLTMFAGATASAEPVTLRFVQTNDIDRMQELDGRGGVAKLAAVIKAQRAKGPTLVVHSGDTLSPSLLSGIDHGRHMIALLNQLGLTAMVPGNHEFDFGPQVLRDRLKEKTFDVVSSNIVDVDGSRLANTLDDKIVEVSGLKIGFYGLTTEDTPIVSSSGDVKFLSSVETGKAKAKQLREAGVDFVVAVVHTPAAVDMLLVRNRSADLVLSGHDEFLLTFYDGRTALTESYSQADYVVVTTVTIDKKEKDGKTSVTWRPSFEIVDTAGVTPDPELAASVKGYTDALDAALKVEIGTSETALDSRRATVRSMEAAIGNLIADAMRAAVSAEIAITNGGGIRADRQYPAGVKLTRADIFSELPFGNKTVKLELTGAQIRAALENGFSQVREGAGRFPQVSGLQVTADLARPPFERVVSIVKDGAPLDPARTYSVATNEFMAGGGDGYKALGEGRVIINAIDAKLMASQVIDYVQARGTVAPKVEGRIVFK